MLKAKILREAEQMQATDPNAPKTMPEEQAPAKEAPAPAPKMTEEQALKAITDIIANTINTYFQKTFPTVLQNALKAQKAPAPAPTAPAAPVEKAPAKTAAPAQAPAAVPKA